MHENAINRCIDYMENYECDNKMLSDLKCIIGWTYLVDLNNPEIAREAFRLAGHKLPIKTKFVVKEVAK